ncbi:multicopy suppressor of BFA (Brefeldin A) [Malassezia pachydermatis]
MPPSGVLLVLTMVGTGKVENAEQGDTSHIHIVKLPGGRPDQKAHNEEMERIKSQIDKTHAKIAQIRAALSGESSTDTPAGKRRAELRAELESLRSEQAGRKGSRGKVFDELKQVQDGIASKVKTLQAAKAKAPFKSVAELDAHIRSIESQIESGSMKIVEERKALHEVSMLKKTRRSLEQFSTQQAEIDTLRKRVEELRSSLDDPETAAANRRYDAIKKELDDLAKEQEKTFGSRSKLQNQRTALSKTLDELYQERRDRLTAYHAENDKYFARVHAERERRNEAIRKERLEASKARLAQEEQDMREEAAMPAFAKEIEDCDVLIRYFSGETDAQPQKKDAISTSSSSTALPTLPEMRRTDSAVPEGAVIARKKGEEEEYFAGSAKKKGKNKKHHQVKQAESEYGALHVPFGMLSALLSLSIPPPANAADLPRVVDNIKLKREYFVSNQARQTEENIKNVEEKIAQLKLKYADEESEK